MDICWYQKQPGLRAISKWKAVSGRCFESNGYIRYQINQTSLIYSRTSGDLRRRLSSPSSFPLGSPPGNAQSPRTCSRSPSMASMRHCCPIWMLNCSVSRSSSFVSRPAGATRPFLLFVWISVRPSASLQLRLVQSSSVGSWGPHPPYCYPRHLPAPRYTYPSPNPTSRLPLDLVVSGPH